MSAPARASASWSSPTTRRRRWPGCSTASRRASGPRISAILVSDDHSHDDTESVGLEYKEREAGLPLTIVRQPRNLGYGGNQKFGYRWAIEHGLDIVVLLHGDGQYAPELLADVVDPIVRGDAEMVLGSRMMAARRRPRAAGCRSTSTSATGS